MKTDLARTDELALAAILLKPLLCPVERNVVSESDEDTAPGTTDGVEMKLADKPLANDIP